MEFMFLLFINLFIILGLITKKIIFTSFNCIILFIKVFKHWLLAFIFWWYIIIIFLIIIIFIILSSPFFVIQNFLYLWFESTFLFQDRKRTWTIWSKLLNILWYYFSFITYFYNWSLINTLQFLSFFLITTLLDWLNSTTLCLSIFLFLLFDYLLRDNCCIIPVLFPFDYFKDFHLIRFTTTTLSFFIISLFSLGL